MSSAQVVQSAKLLHSEGDRRAKRPKLDTYEIQSGRSLNKIQAITSGSIEYRFMIPKGKQWRPRESYFRYRIKVTKSDNSSIQEMGLRVIGDVDGNVKFTSLMAYDIDFDDKDYSQCLAYNAGSTPWQQMTLTLGGTPINTTNHVPIVDTALKRLMINEARADILGGPDLKPGYLDRHRAITSSASYLAEESSLLELPYDIREICYVDGSQEYEFTWTPSFAYWSRNALPHGDYQLTLLPVSETQLRNSFLNAFPGFSEDFEFEISGLQFFITTMETGGIKGMEENYSKVILDFDMIEFQQKQVEALGAQNTSFDIGPSTHAVITGWQSSKNFLGQSMDHPRTQMIVQHNVINAGDPLEKDPIHPKNRYWIQDYYQESNGVIQPINHYRSNGAGHDKQLLRQIFHDNQIKTGNILTGNTSESFEAFNLLGPLLYFNVASEANCPPRVNTYYNLGLTNGQPDKALISPINQIFMTLSYAACTIEYDQSGNVQRVVTQAR